MGYDLGDLVPLSAYVRDLNGNLADPGTLTVTVTLPDLTTVSGVWSAGSGAIPPVRDALGTFHVDYAAPQLGNYKVAWVATGANSGAWADSFTIDDWVSIVGLAEVKTFLNITSTTNDEELRTMMLTVSNIIEGYTNQPFTTKTITRVYSGDWSDCFLLPFGMTAVSSVTENGVVLSPTNDYAVDSFSSVIYRRSGPYYTHNWLPGVLNISITGTVGSTLVPRDIRTAGLLLVRHLWATQRGGMVPVLGTGTDEGYGPPTGLLPPEVRELLDNYRNPAVS
jgi:hypothetical protein